MPGTSDGSHLLRTLSGPRFARAVRGQWSLENSLHWVLDVTFDKDQSPTRERTTRDGLPVPVHRKVPSTTAIRMAPANQKLHDNPANTPTGSVS